jgi:hypothetical protein
MRHSPKEQGTEKDLGSVYRRTPRGQKAICNGGDKQGVGHQECDPFFRIFEQCAEFTPSLGFVSRMRGRLILKYKP